MRVSRWLQPLIVLALSVSLSQAQTSSDKTSSDNSPNKHVQSLKILVLSTMLADPGIGEWGYAAVVEVDGHRILFDTGSRPDTVLINAKELGVDLASIKEVVLSHNHDDHTG